MKKLAGTRCGANAKILSQFYTSAVRPVAEYASTSLSMASRTNNTRLDNIENTELRIILGAMKTTPTREMEQTVDVESQVQDPCTGREGKMTTFPSSA